jgi:hypothetical protein
MFFSAPDSQKILHIRDFWQIANYVNAKLKKNTVGQNLQASIK